MKPLKNVAASVHQRLKNLAHSTGQTHQYLLTHYAIERFLYRVSVSAYSGKFILKGALSFLVFAPDFPRATRDLDFLSYTDNRVETLSRIIHEICQVKVEDDGLHFDLSSITGTAIHADSQYSGVRVKFAGYLGGARIPMQIDFGFGDVVIPPPAYADYPSLLDFPAPRIRVYPLETVLAEKIQAILALDLLNSRLKDFYDVWFLTQTQSFEGAVVAEAFRLTFARRETDIPRSMAADFLEAFALKNERQWQAFQKRLSDPASAPTLPDVLTRLERFTTPLFHALTAGGGWEQRWVAGSGWSGPSA